MPQLSYANYRTSDKYNMKTTMFLENKYTKWYYAIVNRAQSRVIKGYSEKHHIIPKSMGGSNSKVNIAALTAREHYVCHLLLIRMVAGPDRSKMSLASTNMKVKGSTHEREYKVNARLYASAKKEASAYLSELNRKRWADPSMRARLVASMKSADRPPIPKGSRPATWTGKTHSAESKAKIAAARKQYWANKRGETHESSSCVSDAYIAGSESE